MFTNGREHLSASIFYINETSSSSLFFLSKEVLHFLGRTSFLSIMQEMTFLKNVFLGGKIILPLWQNSNIIFIEKWNIVFTKHNESIIFRCIFWEKSSFIGNTRNNILEWDLAFEIQPFQNILMWFLVQRTLAVFCFVLCICFCYFICLCFWLL